MSKHQNIDYDALFVDLDGTLVSLDLLRRGVALAVRRPRWGHAAGLLALLWGRAAFKHWLAERISFDTARLPYRKVVLELIHRHRARGIPVVLATAADERWADAVAKQLGTFDCVLASDGRDNLKGRRKLAAIKRLCRTRNWKTFAYAGDSRHDLVIWSSAGTAYVVAPSARLVAALRRRSVPFIEFRPQPESVAVPGSLTCG